MGLLFVGGGRNFAFSFSGGLWYRVGVEILLWVFWQQTFVNYALRIFFIIFIVFLFWRSPLRRGAAKPPCKVLEDCCNLCWEFVASLMESEVRSFVALSPAERSEGMGQEINKKNLFFFLWVGPVRFTPLELSPREAWTCLSNNCVGFSRKDGLYVQCLSARWRSLCSKESILYQNICSDTICLHLLIGGQGLFCFFQEVHNLPKLFLKKSLIF